jgi:uridine phosphorylase
MPRKRSRKDSTPKSTRKRRVEDPNYPEHRQVVTESGEVIEVPEIVEELKVEEHLHEPDVKIKTKRHVKARAKEVPRELDIRAQFPIFDEKVMHLATKRGDVANRVIVCVEETTAWRLARFFDNPTEVIEVISTRHFRTYTGLFQGIPVSVIASGMGAPMVDFTMREAKFCIDGPMAVVRLGTCCSVSNCVEGDVVISTKGSFNVLTDFDARQAHTGSAYKITDVVPADDNLSGLLKTHIRDSLPNKDICKTGLNGTTDSFYGSQARFSEKFNDENEYLINEILEKYPDTKTLDMETFGIVATAAMAKKKDVFASAVSLVVLNRMQSGGKVSKAQMVEIEDLTGYGIFKALAGFDFPGGEPLGTLDMIKKIKFSPKEAGGKPVSSH